MVPPEPRGKKIRDPIHNYIEVEPAALEILDTPRFQRLRRLHQLGTADLVYPGANHTRFEHSLGAYHLAKQATRALGLPEEEALAVRLASLLHDVGHGPFSHLTDHIMKDTLGKGHAQVSCEALGRGTLRDILERHDVDPGHVADLIVGRGKLSGLVSGDFDVDRMDYLVRDSHYTGVHTGVDLGRLVHGLTATPDGIALRESALAAAEMLLVTRFNMYATVYFHPTCRVAEMMLDRAIRCAIDTGEIAPSDLPNMDDVAITYLLRHSKKSAAWRLQLALDQRKLHKVAAEVSYDELGDKLAKSLGEHREEREELERAIAERAGLHALDVIVDAPPAPVLPEMGALLLTDAGRITPLSEASHLVSGLHHAQRDHWRTRVIVPPSRREEAGRAAHEILEEHYGIRA